MEFHWSTFILEIINFLILVWILKYFLYKPVLKIIEQRKADIQKDLDDAQAMRDESHKLQKKYEHRLQEWQQEKQRSLSKLHEEIDLERERLMKELKQSLEQEQKKARVLEAHRLKDTIKILQQQALRQGTRFTATLLSRLASPELESLLFALLLEDLNSLSDERQELLQTTAKGKKDQLVKVSSSNELSQSNRKKLEDTLNLLAGTGLAYEYQQEPRLLSGLRIVLGPWMLHANLQDELQFFSESVHE